jgi:phosphatidylglycerophosphate synthase
MDEKLHLSTFSQTEESAYERFQRIRDRFFRPVCAFLDRLGVKPDYLSYFHIFLLIPYFYFMNRAPILAAGVICLSLLIDCLDGGLARYQKSTSDKGALLDIVADHFVFFGVVFSLMITYITDRFFSTFYLMNYLLMIVLVMAMRANKLHVPPIVRSKYFFYFLCAMALFTGHNYLHVFLVFFSVYMLLTNIYLFHKYRCSLK